MRRAERERVARDEDPPVEDDEGLPVEEQARSPEPDGGWEPPEMRSMSRYGGGIDVYMRRRLIALLAIVALAVAAVPGPRRLLRPRPAGWLAGLLVHDRAAGGHGLRRRGRARASQRAAGRAAAAGGREPGAERRGRDRPRAWCSRGTRCWPARAAPELQGPFALDEGGGLPSFDFALDGEVAGFGVDGQLVSTGDDAFVVFFGENYRVGPQRVAELEQDLRAAREEGGPPALALQVDEWFRDPALRGDRGRGRHRDRAGRGNARLARGRPGPGRADGALGAPALLRELARGARDGPVQAWVAYDDHTIRRFRTEFPFAVPAARQAAVGDISGGAVTIDAQISDVGAEVSVEPPAGRRLPADRGPDRPATKPRRPRLLIRPL